MLFRSFRIQNVLIEDQSGDTLLQATAIDANFNFWQLFRKKIVVSSITLDQVKVHLQKEVTGEMNFSFLINREASKPDSTFLDLKVGKLRIKDSRLDYANHTRTKEFIAFNPDCMSFTNINSEITIKALTSDSINATLRYLSAVEQSGLQLENLTFLIRGSNKGVSIHEFQLELPDSDISLKKIDLKAADLKEIVSLHPSVTAHAPIKSARIALNDLKAFIPGFAGSKEHITLNALLTGRFSNLKVQDIRVEYGNSLQIDASVEINGLPNIEESFIYANINTLQINHAELQDLVARIQNRPFMLPKEVRQLGLINYQGNITGFLSDLVAFGIVKTNLGNISSDISLRFENHLRDLYYNGTLRTAAFNMGRFLSSEQLGNLKMNINTKGTKLANAALRGTMTATVDELEFNSYAYTNSSFKGEYDGNGFNGNITIKDENIDADFSGILDFRNPRLPVFDFDLLVKNTDLHALHLIKQYPGSRLSFHGTTNLTGNNLDNLNGNLRIEDVTFSYLNDSLSTGDIVFNSRTGVDYTNINIMSEFLNGSFSGDFKYSTIGITFRMVLARYLPS